MSQTPAPFTPTLIPGLRSPYQRVGGIVHFGRMLDKIRLHAVGKLPPAWVEAMGHSRGLDTACCTFLRIEYAKIRSYMAAHPDATDETVLAWCFENGRKPSDAEIFFWSDSMSKRGWRDPLAERVRFRLREAGLPEDAAQTVFDFIEVDEGRQPPALVWTQAN